MAQGRSQDICSGDNPSLPFFPFLFFPSLFFLPSFFRRKATLIIQLYRRLYRAGSAISFPSGSGPSPVDNQFLVNLEYKILHLTTTALVGFLVS